MPKYPCSQCNQTFETLLDVSEHLSTHNSIARSTLATEQISFNITTKDMIHVPERNLIKSDIELMYAWYDFFNEYFEMELPQIKIRWLRRNAKNNLGVFQWCTYEPSNANTQWKYCDEGDIWCRINLRCGRSIRETLNTLIHEMVHFWHNIQEGFAARTWKEAHTGLWKQRSDEINAHFEKIESPLKIMSKGGDNNSEERVMAVKDLVNKGSIIEVKDESGNFTAFVKKRNKVRMRCEITRGTSRYPNGIEIMCPYSRVVAVDGLDINYIING